jgi:mannose-6-phosphate isomerase-like protein (cupin superfamily)
MKLKIACFVLALGLIASASATESADRGVLVIDHAKVKAAFDAGSTLLKTPDYKVLAGRRVMPGEVELHEHDTDIFYIVEGSATFVTGGTTVEPRQVSNGEIRGKSINGGTPHHLSKGDIILIPTGVPHQFVEVSGTFLYYVVKVTK